MNSPLYSIPYYTRRNRKKGYWIYHFYFQGSSLFYWSVAYKVKGNKRRRPKRLIMCRPKEDAYNYFPYILDPSKFSGYIKIGEERWKELNEEIEKRERRRAGN